MKKKVIMGVLLTVAAGSASALVCGEQDVSVEFYTPRTVRIVKKPLGTTFVQPFETVSAKPGAVPVATTEGATATWSSAELQVRFDATKGVFSFHTPQGATLLAEARPAELPVVTYASGATRRPKQAFLLAAGEPLYGLGDLQNGRLNQRGEHNSLTPRNVGDGIAYFASPRGYAVWWDNPGISHVNDNPDGLVLESESGAGVDYYFMFGGSGDGCVAEMRQLTGDVPMFPRWAYGFWQSRERYKTPEETVEVVRKYRAAGIPMDGIVQDWQYWGGNCLWNAMEFVGEGWMHGHGENMIKSAHAMNAKMLITVWQSFGPATKQYRELAEKNLLFPFETWPASTIGYSWPPRRDYPSGVRLCDNFSPVTRDIYWKHLLRLWNAGIDGWWMDSTDPDHFAKRDGSDMDYVTSLKRPYRDVRSAYPVSATKGVYEHQRAATNDRRVFILTRGAGAGQQRFATSVWSGDIGSNWGVLRAQIPGALNYTVTGNPQWNCDLGGFFAGRYGHGEAGAKNLNYRELYARWMQLGTFLPMMRSHGTDIPREVYLYGQPGEEIYDAMVDAIKLRYRLMPYLYSLAGHVTKDRASFMRPLWFDFPNDSKAQNLTGEFMLGESMLVAPVLKAQYTREDNKPIGEYEGWDKKNASASAETPKIDPNALFKGERDHEVYLPAGCDWYDFATGKKYAGGQTVTLKVTMRSQPCFVKAGAILPLGPDVQYNGEKDWSTLTVRVYPGADGALAFYEDAFDGYGYEKGEWSEIPFVWNDAEGRLTVGPRQGAYPGMIPRRVFNVEVVGRGSYCATLDTLSKWESK